METVSSLSTSWWTVAESTGALGGESEGVTRTTTEEFIAKARHDAREGRLNLPRRRKVPLTFSDALPKYIERLLQEDGKDIEGKRRRLEGWVMPFFGPRPLSQITSFDIERYKKQRMTQPILTRRKLEPGETPPPPKPATINRELAALSHLLNKAVEWEWIDRPPARIKKLPEDNRRIVYLTPAQANTLLEAAKGDQNPQIYPFILIGLRTGMRKSEILSIRREHIDLPSRTIFIPHAKAGARTQPISTDLAEYLVEYVEMLPQGTPVAVPVHSG